MTTRAAQTIQVCDYCHTKPKFSNHRYCSKTCASEAKQTSTLCIQCHLKPKFQGFDFCGKKCAAMANPAVRPNAAGATQPAQGIKTQQPAFSAGQIAQFVAQQVPQVKALLAALNPGTAQQTVPQQQMPVTAGPQAGAPKNNPFLQPQVPVTSQMSGTLAPPSGLLFTSQPQTASAQPPSPNDDKCLIPGCGKPVHVDAKGLKTSDYCSQKHREEAVTTGVADACIMCLTMPQSDKDFFCSRACREDAMSKLPE